jgi:hypothetical protein
LLPAEHEQGLKAWSASRTTSATSSAVLADAIRAAEPPRRSVV